MPPRPADTDLTFVQGSTFLRTWQRVENKQVITFTGSGTGLWTITLYSTTTTGLALTATGADVQNALRALPRVGSNGVDVTGSAGGPWTLTWNIVNPATVANGAPTVMPLVTITAPAGIVPDVDYVPFDWTGWTADFKVKTIDTAIPYSFVTTVVAITSTVSGAGQVILGYVAPAADGGTPGTPVLTNGNVAILVTAATTATMTGWGMQGAASARHGLQFINGTYKETLLNGNAFLLQEVN